MPKPRVRSGGSEIENDGLEEAIGKGKLLGVSHLELQRRITAPGFFHHSRRKVDSRRDRAAHGCGARNIARAAGDIKDPHAVSRRNGIEQRLHGLSGDRRPGIRVARGNFLPTLVLEGAKCGGIDVTQSGASFIRR
jgi:hypothetical protein